MKLTMAERWVRRLTRYPLSDISRWAPYAAWFAAAAALFNSVVSWQSGMTGSVGLSGFSAGIMLFSGFLQWERLGWLEFMNSKDAELRQMRESRDHFRRELDALPIDQRGGEPETRIRE